MKETALYKPVSHWLQKLLKDTYKRSNVSVFDTHKTRLSSFLERQRLADQFPECAAYDIQVDLTAILRTKHAVALVFVECKSKPIRLLDIGQLLGYTRIVNPSAALLISPEGASQSLQTLLRTFGRYDLLTYGDHRSLVIAQWDVGKKQIDYSSLLPPGPLTLSQ